MNELYCRGLLWLVSSVFIIIFENLNTATALILMGFILCCAGSFINHPLKQDVFALLLLLISYQLPCCGFLCILTCFDFLYNKQKKSLVFMLLTTYHILWTFGKYSEQNIMICILYLFLCIISIQAGKLQNILESLQSQLIHSRDESVEKQEILEHKYTTLRERQDNELHMATLKERNRIAREIHDNIGHGLSRSLIQLGAIMTINRNTEFEKQLEPLKLTLNEAMTNIRNSVHDLHNDSIDFSVSLQHLLEDMSEYDIHLTCNIESGIPQDKAYCILAIIKEAFTNIRKHSNATSIEISALEFSDFYRLIIEDNGTSRRKTSINNGIGLKNMESRVQEYRGTIYFSNENGFRIFVSIPKEGVKK